MRLGQDWSGVRWPRFVVVLTLLLGGCGSIRYTVDDGRKVDEKLLADIRSYGKGQDVIVPAIVRSATLNDPECDTQWELPFSVATSYEWQPDDKVAWVRGLNVDERLSVIAATRESGLVLGDKIVAVDRYKSDDTKKMFIELMDKRDSGRKFVVTTAAGKSLTVSPLKVCRGHVRVAPPNTPEAQDYHWEMSIHPLEAVRNGLTNDEALWLVLWTQGLSEEGGARMKTFQYGKTIISTLVDLASLVSGAGAIVNAATVAAARVAATKAAASALSSAARDSLVRDIIVNEVGRGALDFAQLQVRSAVVDAVLGKAQELVKDQAKAAAQSQMVAALHEAAANRSGLSGVAWVAGTVFDRADAWAFRNMLKLNADPLAAFSLHYKLMTAGFGRNAFVLDAERLPALTALARQINRDYEIASILGGYMPSALELNLDDLAQASTDAPLLMPSGQVEPAKPVGYNLGGFIEAMVDVSLAQQSK